MVSFLGNYCQILQYFCPEYKLPLAVARDGWRCAVYAHVQEHLAVLYTQNPL